MAIRAGQRLGPYEILSAIGAGGMGEVYRAQDTRLDRTVAIKILQDHLADRVKLRERFERGAKEEGPINLFWQLADGSGKLERLNTSEYLQAPHSWSPDGQLLAFVENNPTTGLDIWVLWMGDPGTPGQARKAQPFVPPNALPRRGTTVFPRRALAGLCL